ncbi:MAG TPA: hypothetical protein VFE57_04625 [Cyclobacteriaceae bacterium]|jgi:hypothetical protein|nr:hypothetical protein [Cyclobacteriaceae bacterium]
MLKCRLFFFFITTILFIGCESETSSKKAYLDIDSLISTQVKNLTEAKAHVLKTASLGNVEDQSEFNPDSLGWTTELDIFRQLDIINKPTNKDSYEIIDGQKDVNSNLTIRAYKAKSELPVRNLKLYYFNDLKNLKKLEAVFAEKNVLYSTERSLSLDFDEIAGKNTLASYSIEGIQKMIISDTVHFTVKCTVIYQ